MINPDNLAVGGVFKQLLFLNGLPEMAFEGLVLGSDGVDCSINCVANRIASVFRILRNPGRSPAESLRSEESVKQALLVFIASLFIDQFTRVAREIRVLRRHTGIAHDGPTFVAA